MTQSAWNGRRNPTGGIRRKRPRWSPIRGDRGSLPLAILVMVVGVGLVALLVPIVIMQNQITRAGTGRSAALAEAEAGIEVVTGQIRAATTTIGDVTSGDASKLPCGPITGSTGDSDGSYTATISYFLDDPSSHTSDAAWLAPQTIDGGGGHAMQCSPNYGTHAKDSAGDDVYVPSFALIRSTATVRGYTRTLYVTYEVQTTNRNISGGFIKIFPPDGATTFYCMDAGDPSTWKVGSPVVLQECPTDGTTPARQRWAYNPNLTIQLTATVDNVNFASLNNGKQGLCLGTSMSVDQFSGQALTLQACPNDPADPGDPSATPPVPPQPAQTPGPQPDYRLMWSIDNSSNLVDAKSSWTSAQSGLGSLRIYVAAQKSGQPLVLNSGSGDVTSTTYTWVPSPDAGAGQAGAPNKQLVNFAQFGRCLDVTGTDVTSPYLILYTCKQDPNPTQVDWNQIFTANPPLAGQEPQTVAWQTNNGALYCLTTATPYVLVKPCATKSSNPTLFAAQQWTVFQTLDEHGAPLAYQYRFEVQDGNGLCLSPGPNDDLHNGQYYKVVVAGCTGTANQKWNADPNIATTGLSNLHEVPGGDGGD